MAKAGRYFDELWRMERRLEQKRLLIEKYRAAAERSPCDMELNILCMMDLEREVDGEQRELDRRREIAERMIAMLSDGAMRRAMTKRYLGRGASPARGEPLGALRLIAKYLPGQPGHELVPRGRSGR